MPTIRITALTELAETPADSDVFALEDISAGTTKKVTSAHVRAGLASNAGLSAEVSAREAHEAAANPHSGSASTTALGLVDTAVSTHVARTDNPHSVTAAQAGAIPATSGAATPYVIAASETAAGISELSTLAEAVTGTDTARVPTVAAVRQAQISLTRDTLGKFPGIMPPSLNLFCGEATSDTAPAGTFARSTTGTRLGQAGLIETVAAGSIRREWGTAGARKGWLVEASATNLLTYSEQFDNAVWAKTGATISANATTAPDGNATADKIVEDTSNFHRIQGQASTILNTCHSLSIFIKGAGRTNLRLYLFNGANTSSFIRASYDLTTKSTTKDSYGNGLATNAQIIDMEDGWYYLTLSGIIDSTTESGTVLVQIRFSDSSGNESYTGDGSSGLYAWGIQLETGLHPTSYIPTTSAAVARSADVWTVPLSTSWFNATAGTLFVSGHTAPGAPASGVVQRLAEFDDGTSNNSVFIHRTSAKELGCYVKKDGSVIASINLGTVADSTAFRVAFSWSASGFAASLNGGTVITASAATLPSGLATHRIGSDFSGISQWGGHVLHDAYFPVALPNTQLQAITL